MGMVGALVPFFKAPDYSRRCLIAARCILTDTSRCMSNAWSEDSWIEWRISFRFSRVESRFIPKNLYPVFVGSRALCLYRLVVGPVRGMKWVAG